MAKRIRMWLPEATIPFLPPPGEFLRIMGLSGGLGGIVRHQAAKNGLSVPDAKTLRNSEKSGVSLRTARQVKEVLLEGVSEDLQKTLEGNVEVEPWLEVGLRCNGLAWSAMIPGFRDSVGLSDHRVTHTENLVRERARQELEFLRGCREIIDGCTGSAANEKIAELATNFLSTNTKISREKIYSAFTSAEDDLKSSKSDSSFHVYSLWTHLKVDFYYRLLCTLSLDLMERFVGTQDISEHRHWLIRDGCFGNLSPGVEADGLIMPFEMLLRSWREHDTKNGEPPTWADIARCLPDPYNLSPEESLAKGQTVSERGADIRKNKKSRLREWRKGVRPQTEQLEAFVRCLVSEDGDDSFAQLKARLAVAWGDFINSERSAYKKVGFEEQFANVLPAFASYEVYWSDYRAHAEKILGCPQ